MSTPPEPPARPIGFAGRPSRRLRLYVSGWHPAPLADRAVRQSRKLHRVALLPLLHVDHLDRVPGAAVQEHAVRPFGGALRASDAGGLVDLDAAEWRMLVVRHPKYTLLYWTVADADGRPSASGAQFIDDRQLLRLALTRIGPPTRHGLQFFQYSSYARGHETDQPSGA